MNKKLLTGLCAVMVAAGLTGCTPKGSNTEDPKTSTQSTTDPKETPKTENTNDKEVTAENFKNFPETDEKYFTGDDWQDGYIIQSCTSEDKVVVVPEKINGKPVLAIGQRGMANLKNCEAIVLPDTVKLLGESAFVADKTLKYIYLGTSLEEVQDNAFNGCSSLESVVFPEGTKKIGVGVFAITKSIKSITIPASVTDIAPGFYLKSTANKDVEIHTPAGSTAEQAANSLELKVVHD